MNEDTSSRPELLGHVRNKLVLKLKIGGPTQKAIYIAGNFNDWKAADTRYQLEKISATEYRLELPDRSFFSTNFEYKYHQDNWDGVELNVFGESASNRVINLNEQDEVTDYVPHWMINGKYYDEQFLPNPHIISEHFEIPQLIKTRRITALLPHDYHKTDKHYPVLYLQDGQNLFDDYAPYGNWALDKKLAMMANKKQEGVIVIAIDHAKEDRIEEFTPSYHTRLGIGEGKKYVRFLSDTLKPYIDKHFRTKPEREHTGIGGSSMGALISIYAGLMYPEVFSKLLIFSPSLWVTPNMHFHFMNFYHPQNMRVYLYGGEGESETMVPSLRRFKKAFEEKASTMVDFELSIDPKGGHNEARWGKEFPRAIEWLFFKGN